MYATPTIVLQALYLVTNVQLLKCYLQQSEWLIQGYLSLLWKTFMMHFVTKAKLTHSIDHKS